jgi:hypothetical protein
MKCNYCKIEAGFNYHHGYFLLERHLYYYLLSSIFCTTYKEKKDTPFIPGGRAAEAFQSLFSHIHGKIRDGYGEDGYGRRVGRY